MIKTRHPSGGSFPLGGYITLLVAGVALGINSEMAFLQSFVICQSWRNELFRIMDRSKATYLCIHRCTK